MQASQDLFDLLVSKDFTVKTLDNKGKPVVDPGEAEMFSFDFEVGNNNYGTVVVLITDNTAMEVYYGDNVGKNMEGDDKDAWYDFLNHIKRFATRNLFQFNLKNMNRLRYTMQGMAAINEGLFEGWNGTKMTSYNNKRSNVRLKIVHDKPMEETDQRWRAVKTMFIETPEGERFKLPFKSTSAGKAMTRHVMEGGNPYDTFGNHIVDIVRETNALARFLRGKTRQVTEDHQDYELVQELKERYKTLRKRMKQITGKRGYHAYKESWDPAQIEEGVVGKLAKRLGKAALKHGAKIAIPAALGTGIAWHDAAEKEKAEKEKAPTAQVVDKKKDKKDMKINDLKESEYDFNDGDLVVLVPPYAENPDEVFTLSQWDGKRGWIGDDDNRGWYVTGDMIAHAPDGDDDDDAPTWDRSSGEDEYDLDESTNIVDDETRAKLADIATKMAEKGASPEDIKAAIDEFLKAQGYTVREDSLAQQINFGGMNDEKESWWDKAKAAFTPGDDENDQPEQSGEYKLKVKEGAVKERFMQLSDMLDGLDEHMQEEGIYGDVDKGAVINMIVSGDIDDAMQEIYAAYTDADGGEGEYTKSPIIDDFEQEVNELMSIEEGFRNELQGGKVPVGNYTFTYEMDNPADLGFLVRSAEERGMAVLAKGKRKARIDGNAGQHTSLVRSLQDLSIRTGDYNGRVTEPHRAGELQMESVRPGEYMIWTVTDNDGRTKQFKGDDETGRRLEQKYPGRKVTTDWVVHKEDYFDESQVNNMRELNEFENWADEVAEGTWAIPDTKDKVKELQKFMSQKQPVGIDGADAQNALYDIIGDDDLMDDLYELSQDGADTDARIVVTHWLQAHKDDPTIGPLLDKVLGNGELEEDILPFGWGGSSPAEMMGKLRKNFPDDPRWGNEEGEAPPVSGKISRDLPSDAGPDGGGLGDRYSPPTKDGVSPPTRRIGEEHDLDTSEPTKKPQRDPMLEANDWARLAGLAGKVYEPIAEETVEEAYSDMEDSAEAKMLKGFEDYNLKRGELAKALSDPQLMNDPESKEEILAQWAKLFNQAFQQGLVDAKGNPKQDESMQQRLERSVTEEWEDEGLDDRSAAQQLEKMLDDGKSLLNAAHELASYYGVEPWEVIEAGDAYGSPELKKLLAGFRKLLGTDLGEGNAFSGALANAKRDGKSEFEVDGKKYKVDEGFEDNANEILVALAKLMGVSTKEAEQSLKQGDPKTDELLNKLAALMKSKMDESDKFGQADFDEKETQAVAPGANTEMPEKELEEAGVGIAAQMGDEEIRDPFPELPQVAHDGDADSYADKYDVDDSHVGVKGKDTADDELSWIKRAIGNK